MLRSITQFLSLNQPAVLQLHSWPIDHDCHPEYKSVDNCRASPKDKRTMTWKSQMEPKRWRDSYPQKAYLTIIKIVGTDTEGYRKVFPWLVTGLSIDTHPKIDLHRRTAPVYNQYYVVLQLVEVCTSCDLLNSNSELSVFPLLRLWMSVIIVRDMWRGLCDREGLH